MKNEITKDYHPIVHPVAFFLFEFEMLITA